jgi:hypothetical protein
MSVTALRPAAPLRLLHPLWCDGGPTCAEGAGDVHRVTHTRWEAGDTRFTVGLIRYDDPRYLNDQRQEVDGNGGPAPEPGSERVELTLTDIVSINHDGSPIDMAVDLTQVELRMLIALLQQELERIERGPLGRDFPKESAKV